jgi:hypothetical protein
MSGPPWVITIDGVRPPSPNQRLHALTRFRIVGPLAASAYSAREMAPSRTRMRSAFCRLAIVLSPFRSRCSPQTSR